MTDVIQLLPDSVANQIAAGEVIQRPASVVKELVENAIDAGASKITVRVVDAGRTSIQVVDDGKGMSETDARLAFERHSTSKIRQAQDLFSLHTMGFRGEALASIAAVAQVNLKTRMADDDIGTRVFLSASKIIKQEPTACDKGSNFAVENLFFNVPARRKFLKSNTTELRNIIEAFERIVLVYPQVAFTFYSNDAELMALRPANTLQRISDIFGKKYAQELLPLSVDTSICKINGFTGKPETARKKGVHQFFFVNGRFMRHPYFNKAVQTAYERIIPTGEQVPYFIYLDVNPEDIDVNIHPTKTEIKFENEQTIWQILAATVKETTGKFCNIPAIDFDTQGKPDIPVFNPTGDQAPAAIPPTGGTTTYNPFDSHNSRLRQSVPDNWQALYDSLGKGKDNSQPTAGDDAAPTDGQLPLAAEEKSPMHYQYKGRYIMTAVKSGLMIIDQHRAHVRILHDEYLQRIKTQSKTAQKLLFPETIQLSTAEQTTLERLIPQIEIMGFELSPLGKGCFAVNSIPAGLDCGNITRLMSDIVTAAAETDNNNTAETLNELMADRIALCMARNAAVDYGQVLSNDEMENIVNRLFACQNVNFTPDGHSILTILPQQQIEKLIG